VNKPFGHVDEVLADDSAPESEYDTKSLKRKKKQNKIRRWAMDKLVKRGTKESVLVGRESPSIAPDADDNISITSKDVVVKTPSLRERKTTLSVGELPPPKPPRVRKIKSEIMETSVMEPLLSTEDPDTGDWYKSGSLFETGDLCDSIMEVIKNIGYTCDSPASSMMQSDAEVPPADSPVQNVFHRSNKCEEEVIANGNVLESDDGPLERTLIPLTVETQNLTNSNQPNDHIYEEIPDEFQRYNGDDKVTTASPLGEIPPSLATRNLREKSVSASDVSLEFFSAHSSPINSVDTQDSPVHENPQSIVTVTSKPAKKLEAISWTSEDSSNGANSSTNMLQESPPHPNVSTTNVNPNASTNDANIVRQNSSNLPNSISIEISEPGSGGVNKDSEPCGTQGELDTGPSYMIAKSQADVDASSATVVEDNTITSDENSEMTSSVIDGVKVDNGTASQVTLTLPEATEPFTSDEEQDENGVRPSSTPEPIIIPLSKSAHEVRETLSCIDHNHFPIQSTVH